jgi:hypothetical protein
MTPTVPLIDVCPHCNKRTEHAPNPYYIHVCEHCNCTYSESDLVKHIDGDWVNGVFTRLELLQQQYPVYYSEEKGATER